MIILYRWIMRNLLIIFVFSSMLSSCLSDDYYVDMVDVKGGTFVMGCEDEEADNDERPLHTVTVNDFRIGQYEVTQKLWNLVMRNKNPSVFKGDNRPVECVSCTTCKYFSTD